MMATIGSRSAVVQLPRAVRIRGTLAWLAWLGLHLVTLLGNRNRISALVNLSWRYLTWSRGGGVIIGDDPPDAEGCRPAPAGAPAGPALQQRRPDRALPGRVTRQGSSQDSARRPARDVPAAARTVGDMPETHEARRARAQQQIAALGADAALITSLVNVRYLSGLASSNAALLLPADGPAVLATDSRYAPAAARDCPDLELATERFLEPRWPAWPPTAGWARWHSRRTR